MHRRRALRLVLVASALWLGGGHTPYGQWQAYRRRHLLIGTSRADAPTYPLGRRVAEVLAAHLPESSARVTRGPDPWRLASLLTTAQIEIVLLSAADVLALRDGRAPFAAFGPTPLRSLFAFGDYWLVCRPDFPDRHAYQVVRTLSEFAALIPAARPPDPAMAPAPVHPGAIAYARGLPPPPGSVPVGSTPVADHVH